ncbi:MAG: hypothetical protein J5I93_25905 [Pirellulaceae bacterium]|nr:hypothetical protein [Pirellulaceae bacterium]
MLRGFPRQSPSDAGGEVPSGNIGSARRTYSAARIIARMPALIGAGSVGQVFKPILRVVGVEHAGQVQ